MKAPWRRRPALRIAALAGVAVALALWQAAELWLFPGPVIVSARVLDGQSVVDGDTLKVAGQSIRLYGIDAPELRQDCDGWPAGEEARRALAAIVTARPVECRRVTTDRYGRTVALCHVAGEEIGATLVRSGMAWAYQTYSLRYLLPEWQALFEGRGVHARNCSSPSTWRSGARESGLRRDGIGSQPIQPPPSQVFVASAPRRLYDLQGPRTGQLLAS